MKRLQTEHSIAYEELRDTKDKKIDTLELNLRKCQQTIVSLESTILKLNITLTEKQDVEKERDLWIHRHNDIEAAKLELSTQLQGASEYILQLESKYYESNQDQLEMLKQLKSHEAEIDNLRQYIIDLKSRIAVYIPVKGDTIDKKLAEYINNYPDR
jgi:chromosome segregation ATPase